MQSTRTPIFKSIGTGIHRFFGVMILWIYTKAFTWALTIYGSLIMRTKMSHNNGIAAVGSIRFVDNPTFPLHPFLNQAKRFLVG